MKKAPALLFTCLLSAPLHAADAALEPVASQAGTASWQTDLQKHRLVEAIRHGDHTATLDLIADLRQSGEALGHEVDFFEARAWLAQGSSEYAEPLLRRFVAQRPGSPNYGQALELLAMLEEEQKRANAIAAREAAEQAERERVEAAFRASLHPVARIETLNTEWKFITAQRTGGPAVAANELLFVSIGENAWRQLKVSRLTGDTLTLVPHGATKLEEVRAGQDVFVSQPGPQAQGPAPETSTKTNQDKAPAETKMPTVEAQQVMRLL